MKPFIRICIFMCSLMVFVKAMTPEEKATMARGLGIECQKEVGATDAELENSLQKNLPTSQTEKCLNSCLFKKVGITKDGKFSPEGAMALTKAVTNDDPKMISVGEKIIAACSSLSAADECEYALELMHCSLKVIEPLGVTLDQII